MTQFEHLLENTETYVVSIDKGIAKRAAFMRAKYKSLKSMDAIQLASALTFGCTDFLTNDKQLKQISEIKVRLTSENYS